MSLCCLPSWRRRQLPGILLSELKWKLIWQNSTRCYTEVWQRRTFSRQSIGRRPARIEGNYYHRIIPPNKRPSNNSKTQRVMIPTTRTCWICAWFGPDINSSSSARRLVLAKAKISSVSTNESLDFFWAICRKRTTSSKFPENTRKRTDS